MKALRLVSAVALVGLPGCASILFKGEPAAFAAHPHLAIVAFDAYDWPRGMPTAPAPPASETLAAAHQVFLAALTGARFEPRDVRVTAPCQGDLGDLCDRFAVASLPVPDDRASRGCADAR